ncbi:MAG: hypothetical protein LBB13_03985 [Rickettsiales bacterium]|jgi:UDP-N-acetylmuramoylalanine-D-glutamate ligase|nr:hypothetical protein [Rickettsiales bacterium]
MIINSVKDGGKTIIVLGTDHISFALGELLREYGNEVSLYCPNSDPSLIYRGDSEFAMEIVRDINSYHLDSIDLIILGQNLSLDDHGLGSNIAKKISQLADKVFLAAAIIKDLFPENKFVAIFGKSYRKIICSALSYIFGDRQTNVIGPATLPTEDSYSDGKSISNLNLRENNIFVLDLAALEMDYLKNLSFDVTALLNLEKEEQLHLVRNFLAKQNGNGVLMVNIDNPIFKDFQENFALTNNGGIRIMPISVEKMVENGYSYVNGTIYNYHNSNLSYDLNNSNFVASNLNELSLLSSFVIASTLDLDSQIIMANLGTFRGLAHNMECLRHDKNIVFIDNSCADTVKLIESPFEMYSNIFAIFVVDSRTGGDLIRLKNHRDNIKLSFLIDVLGIVDDPSESCGNNVKIEKIDNVRDALAKIIDYVTENGIEDEIVVLLSPMFIDKMNNVYYSSYGDEFKKLVEGL